MAQELFDTIDPDNTSGTQLAGILDNFKAALLSSLSGTSRPSEIEPGGTWLDVSQEASPNFLWKMMVFDGTDDIEIYRVNLATNAVSISSADTSFEISKVSADSVAAILKLTKARIANAGRVNDGDSIGEVQFVGTDDTGAEGTTALIGAEATDNFTAAARGTDLVFEATPDGSASRQEMARLSGGKFGVGTVTPAATLHAKGDTGILSERSADDAVGAKLTLLKSRVTDPEALSDDVIGAVEFQATDDVGTKHVSAYVQARASEAHLSTALGTTLDIYSTNAGATAATKKMEVGSTIETVARLDMNSLQLKTADVATAATIAAMDASKAVINFTGSTATSLQGISATSATQVVVLHNRSTAAVTVKHADAAATAANRFMLPDSQDIEILPNSSAEFFYSTADSRWKVKSGSGSGGGAYRVTTEETLAGGGTISSSTTVYRQLRYVKGTGGETTVSTTPFGTGANWKDGAEITLIGTDDDNPVVITSNDAANGAVGFGTIVLTKYKTATFVYSATMGRWILQAGGL